MKFVARAVKVTIELLEFSLIFAVVYAQVLDDKNVRRRFRASNYQVQVFAAKLLSEQSLTFPLGITVDNTRQAFHMHDAYATR